VSAGGKDLACLALLTLALLLPFVGKPLHIDDPMYVWTAQHIVQHPLDFYGLSVNWLGAVESMATAQQNPPGVAYWLALVGALFGWSEPALHTGMLVPAVLAVIGVWLLAPRLGAPPARPTATMISPKAALRRPLRGSASRSGVSRALRRKTASRTLLADITTVMLAMASSTS